MKPSVQIQSDQPKKLSKREDKKSVNHNWNSRLFFQLGLVVSLLITGVVLESTLGLSVTYGANTDDHTLEEPPMITYVVEKPRKVEVVKPKKKTPPVKPKQKITSVITPVSNETPVIETPMAPTTATDTPLAPTIDEPKAPVIDDGPKSIMEVDIVPIFPGCEGLSSNEDRIACMSSKVKKFISRKFNTDKFHYLDGGSKVRMYVDFRIDKYGNVTDITARAPDKKLEEEASRVVGKLPQMTPGKQKDVPVDVQYLVPIIFQIQ